MEHQGIEYTVVRTIGQSGWKWSFEREGRTPKTGIAFDRAEAIRAALHKKIPGEIEVQEVSNMQNVGNSQEVLITTGAGVKDLNIQTVRGEIVSALNDAFNPGAGWSPNMKLDLAAVDQRKEIPADERQHYGAKT